jgi:hypothetical protein
MTQSTYYRDRTHANRFFFIPGDPTPELAPNGAPTLSLWVTDNDARLQLGVQWKLGHGEEAQLRRNIAREHSPLTAGDILLQPAPVQVQAVELLIRDGAGTLTPAATARSSGFPPFTTLFALTLNAAQKNDAVAALQGQLGYLAIRYTIIASNAGGQSTVLARSTDVGDWFVARRGSEHIHVMPMHTLSATAPTAAKPSLPAAQQIVLPGPMKTAPIAFVNLEWGQAAATLRPPAFADVSLAVADVPLHCTTHYTQGKPYSTVLTGVAPDQPYALTPADVGLAAVTVSAPEHHATGAHEVRVQVRYLPAGSGTDDERTVYLRGDHWQEAWWVITRHATLDGELEVTAKITEQNGAVHTPPRRRQSVGEVVIGKV